MKPVDMVSKPGEQGDCLRACVASIFDLKPQRVPHFCEAGNAWAARLRTWARARGFDILVIEIPSQWPLELLPFHYILMGKAVSGGDHACVYKGGKLVHDPDPTIKSGIDATVYPQHYLFFVKR
jgi:hypothetical protein